MIRKRLKIILMMSLIVTPIGGLLQAKEVKGIVVDNQNRPIEFANVSGFVGDSIVNGCVTDSIGFFSLFLPARANRLRISSLGYATSDSPLESSDVGIIKLKPAETILKEITVKAPLIRREADRIVLSIAANPLSANKDAMELLKTAPGVWASDDRLSIYGQGGTSVYIDDRKVNMSGQQLMTYLKSIQSSAIATIEIIPKAGAEYSADSSGGIIKINLKRTRVDGHNGSAGLNVTAGEYKQWINPFVNLSLHKGRWTLNFNGNFNESPSDRHNSHEETINSTLSMDMTGVARHEKKSVQGTMSLGIFYEPTGKDKIGFQLDYNRDKTKNLSSSRTETIISDFCGSTLGTYKSQENFHNFTAAINWSHFIDDKGSILKLITNYNFQKYNVKEENKMWRSFVPNDSVYNTSNHNRYNIFVADLSLRKVLSKNWDLNIGAKYTLNNVVNNSFHSYFRDEIWTINEKYDYETLYNENITALYATANGKAGRWKFKVGIRGEHSKTVGRFTADRQLDLFPNANISYSISEKGDYTVGWGYSRKIRRPSFQSLNPIERQVSDYTYTVGNPDLTPSFTDAISLDFVLAGHFTVAAGYSTTENPIRQMFISNPDFPERLYLTWKNEGTDRNMFVHGDGRINLTTWWNLFSSMTYMLVSQKLTDTDPCDTFSYLQLMTSTTFMLPRGFNITINCFYNSRMKIGNITVFPILNLNPTFQKQFGKQWSVVLGIENMLQRISKIRTSSSGLDRLTYSKSYMSVKIGATYKFDSGKRFKNYRIEKNIDNSRFNKE